MSIYEEKPEKPIKEVKKPSDIDRPDRWRECDYGCNIEHSVVYLTGEIDEHTGHEFIARSRTVLLNRPEENQDDPLTVLLDSLFSVIYILIMFRYSPKLTFYTLSVIPFFIIWPWCTYIIII